MEIWSIHKGLKQSDFANIVVELDSLVATQHIRKETKKNQHDFQALRNDAVEWGLDGFLFFVSKRRETFN